MRLEIVPQPSPIETYIESIDNTMIEIERLLINIDARLTKIESNSKSMTLSEIRTHMGLMHS